MLDYYSEGFSPQGLMIDVGCGYGVLADYLALKLRHIRVMGIDLNKTRVHVARRTIGSRSNIDFLTEDAARWTWPSCTGIAMTDFLHHVAPADQEAVLHRAFQSLEKDGVLLVSEVDAGARPLYRYWASYLSDRVLYPLSKSCFRRSSGWRDTLSRLGFNVRIVELWNPIFGGVAFVC